MGVLLAGLRAAGVLAVSHLPGCLEHVVVQPLQPRSLPRWPKIVGPRTTMVSCHRQLLGGRLRAGGRASRPSRNRVPYRQCRGCPKTSLRHVRLPSFTLTLTLSATRCSCRIEKS